METGDITVGLLAFLAVLAFLILRRDLKYKTELIVNVETLEKYKHDLPIQRIRIRKTLYLSAQLAPGMRVKETPGGPLAVLETVITVDKILVYLEPYILPSCEIDDEIKFLREQDWKIDK